jgi:acetoin utilization protein AcuC
MVWDDQLAAYDLGRGHPLAPVRVELTVDLIRRTGLLGNVDPRPGHGSVAVDDVLPGAFDEDELRRLHRPDFVEAVRRLSAEPGAGPDLAYGLGPGDTPAFRGMHGASMLVCAATKEAARQVWDGEAIHAFSPAGGLHHAMPDRAAGFCIYNDPAAAIDWLLEHGAERIGYVDVDVHHGDGVEHLFADDPRVLTISLHESGRYLFPGTGFVDDIGGPGAAGSVANLPLHPGTTGEVYLHAFDAVIDPLVRAFAPDILVTQLGCDTHATDPLAHLSLTVDDQAATYARLHALAHEVCEGRWLATGGGGYQLATVVPRAWTLAFAEMTGRRLPVETPMGWREVVTEKLGTRAPTAFTDDPVHLSDELLAQTRRAADEVVEAWRALILPRHGVRG